MEGPAFLSYAHRVQQLPLALFGIAISSALMPPLTRAMKLGDMDHFKSLLTFGFSRTFSLLLPGTVAIFVLGGVSVNLLYGRGMFSNFSTIHTTTCLWGYGIGLVPSAFVLILAPAFYAKRDFWTPTIASIWSVAVNLVLNLLFVLGFHLSGASIAVATSLASFFNMFYLLKKMDVEFLKPLYKPFLKTTIASLVAGLFTVLIGFLFFKDPTLSIWFGNFDVHYPRALLKQIHQFGLLTFLFGISFLGVSYWINAEHVLDLFFRKREEEKQNES
jgi:putative peptidoglycan lipid II flippase